MSKCSHHKDKDAHNHDKQFTWYKIEEVHNTKSRIIKKNKKTHTHKYEYHRSTIKKKNVRVV